ncbi:MAG: TonB-dependent receptor [Polyangiales bacterium]
MSRRIFFGPEGIGTISRLREQTAQNDAYSAMNSLVAAFAMLESPITKWLKFTGGVRIERFAQQVDSFSPIPNELDEKTKANRSDLDFLPSAAFSFRLNKDMFIKLGYGMTVARPAIRELAPSTYVDFLRGWNVTGNENLNRTLIQNSEVRYEWYIGESDLFAATAFFKHFNDPIEFVVNNQVNRSASYANADKALLAGGEIESRIGLKALSKKLEKFYFGGNLALVWSEETFKPDNTISSTGKRRLFNQSNVVTNMSLRFDDPDSGVAASLVYNFAGPRITEVGGSAGTYLNPNVYEHSPHQLDFIASWKPTDTWKLKFKWKNMLFQNTELKQGNAVVQRTDVGTSISVGAEYSY